MNKASIVYFGDNIRINFQIKMYKNFSFFILLNSSPLNAINSKDVANFFEIRLIWSNEIRWTPLIACAIQQV